MIVVYSNRAELSSRLFGKTVSGRYPDVVHHPPKGRRQTQSGDPNGGGNFAIVAAQYAVE